MELFIIVLFIIGFFADKQLNKARKRKEANEELKKYIDLGKITPEDEEESTRLMYNEDFIKLKDAIISSLTKRALSDSFTPKYVTHSKYYEDSSALVTPDSKKADSPVSYVLGIKLERLGFKPLEDVDKIRVLFYTLSKYAGIEYKYELSSVEVVNYTRRRVLKLTVYTDDSYWDNILEAEKRKREIERTAGLHDLF